MINWCSNPECKCPPRKLYKLPSGRNFFCCSLDCAHECDIIIANGDALDVKPRKKRKYTKRKEVLTESE